MNRGCADPQQQFLHEIFARDKTSVSSSSWRDDFKPAWRNMPEKDRLRAVELIARGLDRPACCLRKLSFCLFVSNHLKDEHCAVLLGGVAQNRSLVELDLSLCTFGPMAFHQLNVVVQNHPTLRILKLKNTVRFERQKDVVEPFRRFMDSLASNQTLEWLDLSILGLDDIGADIVGSALAQNRVLRYLDVSSNLIESKGALLLAEGLCRNQGLREIDVSSNPSCNSVLFAALTSSHPTLSVVRCGSGSLGDQEKIDNLQLRTALADKGNVVRSLDLGNNELTNVGVEQLCLGIAQNTMLEELDLTRCFYTVSRFSILHPGDSQRTVASRSLKLLAEALRSNTTLKRLTLKCNGIRDVDELCEALRVNTTLQQLDLSRNQIVDLRQILNASVSLRDLDLSGNTLEFGGLGEEMLRTCRLTRVNLSLARLGGSAATVLLNRLASNTSILVLNLSRNGIGGPENEKALCNLLSVNNTITELDLERNRIVDEGGCIGQGLSANTSLRTLNCELNPIGEEEGAVAIGRALESNQILQHLLLSIGHVRLGPIGIDCLFKALLVNRSLVRIGLHQSLRSEGFRKSLEALLTALEGNHGVTIDFSAGGSGYPEIDFYNSLNRDGVWDLVGDNASIAKWPLVLANAWTEREYRLDLLFLILTNRPEICLAANSSSATWKRAGGASRTES